MAIFTNLLTKRYLWALLSTIIGLTLLAGGMPTAAGNSRQITSTSAKRPPDQPLQGLIYDGLERAESGPCRGGYRIGSTDLCTHGPDAPPSGANVFIPAPLVAGAKANQAQDIVCEGDGVTGRRVQVLYVRAADKPDRFADVLASIQTWAAGMDAIYSDSATATGGSRHLRFVTAPAGGGCAIDVASVTISAAGDDSFGDTIDEIKTLGYGRQDRKYQMFVDASVYCGIGTVYKYDEPDLTNRNNQGPSYARTDTSCWGSTVAAHEFAHNLGGVQDSAPNSTLHGHCFDEYDIMCYNDSSESPPMQYICPQSQAALLDCNHDDYYNTNPSAGSYLATHWNVASNSFLIGSPQAPPMAPYGLGVEAIGQTSISLRWTDSGDEAAYTVYRLQSGSYAPIATLGAGVVTYTDSGLTAKTTYYYRLTATNPAGESPQTNAVKAKTGNMRDFIAFVGKP